MIDAGRCGLTDRYQDLAILWNSLEGDGLRRRLRRGYGLAELDQRRLRFHLLLDEFF